MYVERGGGVVVGVFYDTSDWVPTILGGRWREGGAVELTDITPTKVPNGRMDGILKPEGLDGSWTLLRDGINQPLSLHAVPKPPCDGKGDWKTFKDERWPFTFSNPVAWRAVVDGKGATFNCPDPELMLYDEADIQVNWDTEGRLESSDFVSCGGTWKYGRLLECDCERPDSCELASVRHRHGMTILGAEIGSRLYCREGGYEGAGSSDVRFVSMDGIAVGLRSKLLPEDLLDRIIDTVRVRGAGKKP
jgi:hypothetical protein